MTHYLPTSKVVDMRVVSSFYRCMSSEAERQGFTPAVFPIIGDMSLGEVIEEMKKQSFAGLQFYKHAIQFTEFAFREYAIAGVETEAKGILTVVPSRPTVRKVIDSWRGWLGDIASDTAERALDKLTVESMSSAWQRAYELTIRRRDEGSLELIYAAELKGLEDCLDWQEFRLAKEAMREKILPVYRQKVAAKYFLPQTDITFSQALESAERGDLDLYHRLVKLHDGFRMM